MAETVSYNGIDLEIVRTNTVRRVPVYTDDGTTYLYTHWIVDVDCIFNPSATAAGPSGQDHRIPPRRAPFFLPAVTDVNLRETLTAPRQQLILRNGATTILESPSEDRPHTDANNGPMPSDICSIQQIVGTKSFLVHFVVETWVNECDANPVILAHRWEQDQDTDVDHFATRTIRGEAIFNGAALEFLGTVPDQYRQDLFHPCPAEYQRQSVHVHVDGSNNRLQYVIVDTQKPVDFPAGTFPGATRIECVQSGWVQQQGIAQSVIQAAQNPIGTTVNSIFATGGWIAAMATGQPNFANGFFISAALGGRNLPRYHFACTTRVFGDRSSIRGGNRPGPPRVGSLQMLAVGVTIGRLQLNPAWTVNEMHLIHDAAAKFVEFTMQVSHGIEGGGLEGISQEINDVGSFNNQVTFARFMDEFVQDEFLRLGSGGQAGGPNNNPLFPNSNQSRGTSLESVFVQALTDPCQIPPRPFNFQKSQKTFR